MIATDDERHLKALDAAHGVWPLTDAIAAYHRSLAEQGVRLVDASEVAEWLRSGTGWQLPKGIDDQFLARFGGGDEG